jgi:acetyl-CoA C-acetyltransferase
VDALAVESQRRAAHAWQRGYFKRSIEPVRDLLGEVILDRDELMRPETTLETLATLKPSFMALGQAGFDAVALQKYPQLEAIDHVHTGGNSSGIVDGAASVLLGNREFGEAHRPQAPSSREGIRLHR